MSDLTYEEPKASKWPLVVAITRFTTLVSLVVAMAILRTNSVSYTVDGTKHPFNYQNVNSYEYVFFGGMVGILYTIQVPFAVYYIIAKKRLINNYGFLLFEFYTDAACMMLLATVVGAAFGATAETRNFNNKETAIDKKSAPDYSRNVRQFCMTANVSGGALLFGFSSSIVSFVMSFKTVRNK